MSFWNKLQHKWHSLYLTYKCLGIVKTKPIITTDAPLVFVTLLQHKDVYPYLVAIKSIYPSFNEGGVIVVDDGSLTKKDKALLHGQIRGIEIRPITSVEMGGLNMRGGCWERLVTLVEESVNRYAVQVDADLVALGDLSDAVECYKANRSFALGNYVSPGRLTFTQMSEWWREKNVTDHSHMQIKAELGFATLADADRRYYGRTTAAFASLAKGSIRLADLIQFSNEMHGAIGDAWDEWGSEQVASNYLVANYSESFELRPPVYVNNTVDREVSGSNLIHFFGSFRFYKGRYYLAVKQAIAQLSK